MGMRSTTLGLVLCECERAWEWLGGNEGNENTTFSTSQPEQANKPTYTIGRKTDIEEK